MNLQHFITNLITVYSFIFTGYQRTSANSDFHDSTQGGKVGPVWTGDNQPLLKVQSRDLEKSCNIFMSSLRFIQS